MRRWTWIIAAICLGTTDVVTAEDQFSRAGLAQYGVDVVDAAMIQGQEWEDIHEGAKKYGISEEMIDEILRAGLNLTCPGKDHNNGGSLNAWLIGEKGLRFYTNAHAFFDENDVPITPYNECAVQLMHEIARAAKSGGGAAQAYLFDALSVVTASNKPNSLPLSLRSNDRATATLESKVPGSNYLSISGDFDVYSGEYLFAFSRKPPSIRSNKSDVNPIIQKCSIRKVEAIDDLSGNIQIRTDCSAIDGVSGELYFVRDPEHYGRLLPIAMGWGAIETPGQDGRPKDGLPFDENYNASMAILLTPAFFKIPNPPPPPKPRPETPPDVAGLQPLTEATTLFGSGHFDRFGIKLTCPSGFAAVAWKLEDTQYFTTSDAAESADCAVTSLADTAQKPGIDPASIELGVGGGKRTSFRLVDGSGAGDLLPNTVLSRVTVGEKIYVIGWSRSLSEKSGHDVVGIESCKIAKSDATTIETDCVGDIDQGLVFQVDPKSQAITPVALGASHNSALILGLSFYKMEAVSAPPPPKPFPPLDNAAKALG